jgi:uncharacterized protein
MQLIDVTELGRIARGSAVLAAGGGGDPFRGELSVSAVIAENGPVTLVDIDELPPSALIASVFLIGAPVALLEKFPFRDELLRALRGLERVMSAPIEAVFSVEAGGVNSMVPFSVASIAGLPLIDADTMGRAYPAMDLTLVNLAGRSSSPVVITDDYGTIVTVETESNVHLERVSRAISYRSGAAVAAAGFTGRVDELRDCLALGSITRALGIGRVLSADRPVADAWRAICEEFDGRLLFEGRVVSANQDIEQGWGVGRITIEGRREYAEATMQIDVVNEYLTARTDGEVVATAPDIITIFDLDSGSPVTSEAVRYGFRVGVVALRADARWLTPEGITLGGPRRFGYDFDYVDFQQAHRARQESSPV